jgi:hypothetical protein
VEYIIKQIQIKFDEGENLFERWQANTGLRTKIQNGIRIYREDTGKKVLKSGR